MRDFWPAYRFVKSMIRIIRALINLTRRPKPVGFPLPPPSALAGVAFTQLPKLQYDVEVFDVEHEEMDIASYLTAKGRTGWRLHTIQRVERPASVVYALTWDRLAHGERIGPTPYLDSPTPFGKVEA